MQHHHSSAITAIISELGERWISRHDLIKKLSVRFSGVLVAEAVAHLLKQGALCQRLDASMVHSDGQRRARLRPAYAIRRDRLFAMNMVVHKERRHAA